MSSWRESDPEPAKPTRPAKPLKSPKPTNLAPKSGPTRQQGTTGWRGKSKLHGGGAAHAGSSASTKDWLNHEVSDDRLSRSTVKKWTQLTLLFVALVGGTLLFIQWLQRWEKPLPFYAISVGKYDSKELRENPYGKQQRQQITQFNRSYLSPFPVEAGNPEDTLWQLEHSDWLDKLQPPKELTQLGDPVTAYYINCLVNIREEPVEEPQAASKYSIELFRSSSSQFSNEDSKITSTIELKELIENIGNAASQEKNRYLWVILDLQLPHTISALGNLSPPWKTAVSSVLDKIKTENPKPPEWYDRLIITIPADDGQNNWLAPEYSASFFGFHLFDLLNSPQREHGIFRYIFGWPASLKLFQESLELKVSQDVAGRRHARQTPVWLPEENLQRWKDEKLVGGFRGSYEPLLPDNPEPRMKQILPLWKKFTDEKYRSAYRWDPVGYARAESRLIALEDIALHQPDSFEVARREAESALRDVTEPQIEYGVSLIEDEIRANYFVVSTSAEQIHSANRIKSLIAQRTEPVFWRTQEDPNQNAGQTPTTELSDRELSDREKQRYVWETYLAAARGDSDKWLMAYQKDRLIKALGYFNQSDNPPLELFLLQRLRDDIDWQPIVGARDRDRALACARAVDTFDRLQRVACHPDPLMTGALSESKALQNAESAFLKGFDLLLTHDFSNAIKSFDRATEALKSDAVKQLDNFAVGIESAQETLWIAPHLLAWLLREYQFSKEGKEVAEIEGRLKTLGDAVDESLKLLRQVAEPRISVENFSWDGASLRELKDEIEAYVSNRTSCVSTTVPKDSPLTFRRNGIAVKFPFPLLNDQRRATLYGHISDYLLKERVVSDYLVKEGEAEAADLTEQTDIKSAIDTFLGQLKSDSSDPTYKRLYEGLITGDARYGLIQEMSAYKLATETDRAGVNRDLAAAELPLRILATAIGDAPSLDQVANSQSSWPFSAASLRWKLAESERCQWQVARLAEAGWGNDLISPSDIEPQDYYFGVLGSRYLSQLPEIGDAGTTNSLAQNHVVSRKQEECRKVGQELLGERARFLNGLAIKFEREGNIEEGQDPIPARISVNRIGDWNATASVFLGKTGQPKPWRVEQPDDWSLPVELSAQGESGDKTTVLPRKRFSASHFDFPLNGNLAIRGNYVEEAIRWRTDKAESIELKLDKDIQRDAAILVDAASNAPILNVVLVLDCSGSMRAPNSVRNEKGEMIKEPLIRTVTRNLGEVIEKLLDADKRQVAKTNICLLPLGIPSHTQLSPTLKNFLKKDRVSDPGSVLIDKEHTHFFASKFIPLDDQSRGELYGAIEELRQAVEEGSTSDTPLYNAIVEACEQIEVKQQGARSATPQIFVFSDGVHGLDVGSPYSKVACDDTTVKEAVKESNSELFIFHYDKFEAWLKWNKKLTEDDRVKKRGEHESGVKALQKLGLEEKIEYLISSDTKELLQRSLDKLPKLNLRIVPVHSPNQENLVQIEPERNGFRASIPAELLPNDFQISIDGSRGEASQHVQLFGGERVELKLSGRGANVLEFPDFEPESSSGWYSHTLLERNGDGFDSNVWYRPDESQYLSFIWTMRQKDHPKQFTARPLLTVGMVDLIAQDKKLPPLILADSYFESGEHYPKLRFAQIPEKHLANVKQAQLTLWVADKLPDALKSRKVEQDAVDSTEIQGGAAKLTWKRSGSSLTVDVLYSSPPKKEDRLVVLCPNAEKARRQIFLEPTLEEKYVFDWSEQQSSQEITIQFTTVGELERWCKDGLVTKFVNDRQAITQQ